MNSKSTNWLFLRGLSREAAHWGTFPKEFEKQIAGAKVTAIDLPGNGQFWNEPTPLTLNELMEFVRAQWKKNPASSEPVHLFAMSLGAMTALQWMHRYPQEIAAAVFVNTSLRGFSPFFHRLSPGAYPSLIRLFLDRDARTREKGILDLTSQKTDWPEAELERREQIQKAHPVKKANAFRQIRAALSTVETKAAPSQPLLLLNSLGDLLVHPDCSKKIAHAWNVPIRRHAWAGHDLALDDPQWTLNAVNEWLNQIKIDKTSARR